MINKMIEKGKTLSISDSGIITPLEIRILELYLKYEAKKVAQVMGMSEDSVYGVFRRIRERRKKLQRGVNFFNNLARDKRLFHVLTPRRGPPEETEEEED